jgi:uncharacterized protein (TIRG00374 family)
MNPNTIVEKPPPSPAAEARIGSRSKIITAAVAFALAGVLLYFSLRGIEWRQAGILIVNAKLSRMAIVGITITSALFLRAFRWRILLSAEGPVSIAGAFWATSAGYLGNNFLPARAGELVRTFMISSRWGLNYAYVLATALSERVADAIALVVISALVLLTLPALPGWLANAAKPFATVGLIGALLIAVLPRMESFSRRLLERLPMPRPLQAKLVTLMEHGFRGIRAFHDGKRLTAFLFLTGVIWCIDATGIVVGGTALGLSIPVPLAFLLIAALGLASALPSTPGFVGIYQFVAVSVLTPFGFSRTQAIAFMLVSQATQYAVFGVFGAIGFLNYRRIRMSDTVSFK